MSGLSYVSVCEIDAIHTTIQYRLQGVKSIVALTLILFCLLEKLGYSESACIYVPPISSTIAL